MAVKPHALVIGGSVGGLLAGAMLREIGWQVTIFERATDDLAKRGAGLALTLDLFEVMRRVGARLDPAIGVQVKSYISVERDGRAGHEIPRMTMSGRWARIYRPLHALFPQEDYRTGMNLVGVEPAADGVTAVFADGSRVSGDLLIGADGGYSTVRSQFLPEVTHQYAGYVAWRGVIEESELPRAARALVHDHLAFSFPDGEMMLTMPIPGEGEDTRPGHRRCYFIWYRPADYAMSQALCTDASGRQHGDSIPPPLIQPKFVEEIKTLAKGMFAPALAEIIEKTEQPLLQPIFDLEAPQLVFDRVVLLGDSAFVARPHVAAGITKAAMDAQCLAQALHEADHDIEAALKVYETARLQFGTELVAYARYLGAYLEGQLKPVQQRSGRELTREPEPFMWEYGAPHLVRDVESFSPD